MSGAEGYGAEGKNVMARSNGNQDRNGAPPARPARGTQPVEHGLPWHQGEAPPQGYDVPSPGQPHNGQLPWPQQQPSPQHYAQPGYPQQGYAQPYAAAPDAHHGHYFPSPTQQPGLAEYGAPGYRAAPPPPAGHGYPSQPAYQDPAEQLRGSYAAHGDQAYAQTPGQAGGYPPPGYGHMPAAGADPRGFDLGAYANPHAGYTDPMTGRGQGAPMPAQHPNAGYAQQQAGPEEPHTGEDDYDEDYEDEAAPRRRFGGLKVVASLAVAIAIGGGMAYGYKKFGGALMAGKPVVLKADATPAKVRPAGADATQLASADQKVDERLGGQVPAVVPAGDANGDNAPGGTRRVPTMAIAPNGTVIQSAPSLRPTISVPGVALEGPSTGPIAQAPQPPPASALPPVTPAPAGRAVAPPPAAPARAPIAPKVIASAEPPASAAATPPPAQRVAAAQPPKPKTNDAYTTAQGVGATAAAVTTTASAAPAAAAPKATTGANGFVAVLSSQGTAIDARKSLDELQGKYTEVLSGKPSDIMEATVKGKLYYRAIVGPPGSREASRAVCEQLKTAGHQDCFVTAY